MIFASLKSFAAQKMNLETTIASCLRNSIADPGCLSRIRLFSIPDPNFSHPGFRIRIEEFEYFNPKKWLKALGNMFRVVHPGSRSWRFTHPPHRPSSHLLISEPPPPRSRIRNTAQTVKKKLVWPCLWSTDWNRKVGDGCWGGMTVGNSRDTIVK